MKKWRLKGPPSPVIPSLRHVLHGKCEININRAFLPPPFLMVNEAEILR
jgi:hypothetical protein